ncbi:MAG: glycosyltransferase family 4 protein [Chthoniobacterales bacterium]
MDRSDASWTAGASYSRSMLSSLAAAVEAPDEICVISGHGGVAQLPHGVREVRTDGAASSIPAQIRRIIADEKIDVVLPVTEVLLPDTKAALVGWIPDFQHRHLPQYFTELQRAQRDRYFDYLVRNCDAMMFSSRAALEDFRSLFPDFSGPATCAPFASSFASDDSVIQDDPRAVLDKYKLPAGFVLVANQFWKHKNHQQVVEAVALARSRNPQVRVVMVGMLSDSRDPGNSHLSAMVRRGCVDGLFDNITVLGEVPRADLVSLIRCAIEVIQPSEFEGWNTTVQDALALGKHVACSDIPTHREQAPGGFFFPLHDADALATHFAGLDWSQGGWGGEDAERKALDAERERGLVWAKDLIQFAKEVREHHSKNAPERAAWNDPIEEIKSNPLTYIEYLEAQVERLNKVQERHEKRIAEQTERTQSDRAKHVAEIGKLRSQVADAKRDVERERAKPLRVRLTDEAARIFGRGKKS